MSDIGTLLGRGIAFEVGVGSSGRFEWSAGPENIRESIRLILMTEPGERIMRPTFGAGLRRFLFEPNVPATHRLIEERITNALARWEPRITVGRVTVAADRADLSHAIVTIEYDLVATGQRAEVRLAVPTGGA
jgi:phage baseplate assembly protein W